MVHATRSQPGDPTCRAISADTMKIPDPIIDPATIVVESRSPSPRTKPVVLSSTATAASAIVVSSEDLFDKLQFVGLLKKGVRH